MHNALATELLEQPLARQVALPLLRRSTSRVGLGTGGLLRITGERARQTVLAAALDSGITHFDTAPVYGFGESERCLGRFLRGRRSQVTLTTKFGLQPSALASRFRLLQSAGRRVLAAFPAVKRAAVRHAAVLYAAPSFPLAAVRASLEASLKALKTDHVDFFLAHQASAQALPGEDVIGLLERLREAGKIGAFGVATELDWLRSVLEARPALAAVVQFDSQLTRRGLPESSQEAIVITYGCLSRSIASCRERLPRPAAGLRPLTELERLDDEALAGLLLRRAVLANPRGIVLMQSRCAARIARNVEAANSPREDERVRALTTLIERQP
jgi:diketogulonate reductase-like aldo/keto reductase